MILNLSDLNIAIAFSADRALTHCIGSLPAGESLEREHDLATRLIGNFTQDRRIALQGGYGDEEHNCSAGCFGRVRRVKEGVISSLFKINNALFSIAQLRFW